MAAIDKIYNLISIDWGQNHTVFLDKRNRVFSMGNNLHGKTGQDTDEEIS